MVSGHLQIKNGRYYAVLNYKDENGKRVVKWKSLNMPAKGNKRIAEKELIKLRQDFIVPIANSDEIYPDMPFHEYLLKWLDIVQSRVAFPTYCSYKTMVTGRVYHYFKEKNLSLQELQARHLQQFYTSLLREVKPNTVIRYHSVIHVALQYAFKTDLVMQNVAAKVDRPRKNDFQPVFLSAEEMHHMFTALEGHRLELPVLVASFYGFRREEVLGLRWDAIDFEQNTISVKHTVTSVTLDGKMMTIAQDRAKTKSSLRTLPLIGPFRDYFLRVRESQAYNKKICGNCYNYEYDGYVFVDEMGERMSPNYLTAAFPKFLVSHGLRRMRFHDLRHSCASLLLANGVPLKQIQEWLGHSDFATTANIYAHLDYSSKVSSAQALASGLYLPANVVAESSWTQLEA